jgi:hypothetical protein
MNSWKIYKIWRVVGISLIFVGVVYVIGCAIFSLSGFHILSAFIIAVVGMLILAKYN